MEYDWDEFEEYVTTLLEAMWRDVDYLEIGEDISDVPEIKIIFDGYGDLEIDDGVNEYQYTEGGNKDIESYAIFVHKDSWKEDFLFPEHETTPWALIHRTQEEVCLYAWYDVVQDKWDIIPMEDQLHDRAMTAEDVMHCLRTVHKRYYDYKDEE